MAPSTPVSAGGGPTSRSTSSPVGRCSPSHTPSRTSASPSADQPTITGAFQRVEAYELALSRWRELGRTAASALVFADFDRSRTRDGVHQIAIAPSTPLAREWAVVCDAPTSAAALAGWERPDGRFEALWSVEPEVVRLATDLGRQLARQHAPRIRTADPPRGAIDAAASLRRATAVTNRAIAYLDR